MFKISFIISCLIFVIDAKAEQGCPPGQYPIGGQGAIACAPLPQQSVQQQPRPSGKWIKTWGAIAMGSKGETPYYGIPVGLASKEDAEREALSRCAKLGASGCHVVVSYRNQCAAIGEPQKYGKPASNSLIQFSRQPTKQEAYNEALSRCQSRNPEMQCEVIFNACSEPVFQEF